MMSGRRDSGAFAPFTISTTAEYRELHEELDHAWAKFTDTQRAELENELKRRRAANPNWPYLTSDHSDKLAARVAESTRAMCVLEEAITGPDGMVLRMRASTSAIDMMREELAKHTEALIAHAVELRANTNAQDLLRASIDRLIEAFGAAVPA